MDVARPGLRVGVDHERVDLPLARLRVQHRQRAVGAAERQVGDRPHDVVQPLTRPDRERREAVGAAAEPARPRLQPPLPAKKPTISYRVSVAAVTSASAADASRGVRPGTPATEPPVIEPETSSASSSRLPVGSTFSNAV